MLLPVKDVAASESAHLTIRELLNAHSEWFLTQDGAAPLALNSTEFDFSVAHRRLIFSSWTETYYLRQAAAWERRRRSLS